MLDIRYFKIPRFGAGSLGVTFAFFTMFSMFFLMAQFLQSVRGYSPLMGGILTLPFAVTMVLVSPRGAALSARFEPKRVVVTGLFIMPVGLVLLSLVDALSPYLLLAIGLIVLAGGSGLAIATLSTSIVLSLPLEKAGVGSAVNDTTREVGGAVGGAVIGSILSSRYRSGISGFLANLPPDAAVITETAKRGVSPLAGLVRGGAVQPSAQAVRVAVGQPARRRQVGIRGRDADRSAHVCRRRARRRRHRGVLVSERPPPPVRLARKLTREGTDSWPEPRRRGRLLIMPLQQIRECSFESGDFRFEFDDPIVQSVGG